MKKYYSIFFLIIVCIFCIPLSVYADDNLDPCIESGECIQLCEYRIVVNDNYGGIYDRINIYYFPNELQWAIEAVKYTDDPPVNNVYPSYYFNTSVYLERKLTKKFYAQMFSEGNDVYSQKVPASEKFVCPQYAYTDLSIVDPGNTVCFDDDGKTCAEKKSGFGRSFGQDDENFVRSEKIYDFSNSLSLISNSLLSQMSCDEWYDAQKNSSIESAIEELVRKQMINVFYRGHKFSNPDFIENNADYQAIKDQAVKSWPNKKLQCEDEFKKKNANGEITHKELEEKTSSLNEIKVEDIAKGIDKAKESLATEVDISTLTNSQKCEGIFGTVDGDGNFQKETFGWLLQKILNYIKIAGPILTILFSMFEFIKAIASSDEESMKKVQSRLVVRIIAVVALFLVPWIVGEALKLINGISNPTCFFK